MSSKPIRISDNTAKKLHRIQTELRNKYPRRNITMSKITEHIQVDPSFIEQNIVKRKRRCNRYLY